MLYVGKAIKNARQAISSLKLLFFVVGYTLNTDAVDRWRLLSVIYNIYYFAIF